MHKNHPEFVEKLYNMLENAANEGYIRWNNNGTSFIILNPPEFARRILESHFKHGNLSSFVRQLNKYDFHKVKTAESVLEMYGSQIWEFKNKYFQRNRRDLLSFIKRKRSLSEKNLRNSCEMTSCNNEVGNMFNNHALSTLKSLVRYFQIIVEDINEMKSIITDTKPLKFSGSRGRVLIIEDSMSCSAYANAILSKMGFNTAIAETEDEAIRLVDSESFSYVVINFSIRKLAQIIQNAKKNNNECTIVLLADKIYKQDSVVYLNSGVSEILIKPYCQETLVQLMSKCMEEKRSGVSWNMYTNGVV